MFVAIGIVVLLAMVFGGFMLAGGAMGPVLAALPLEFMMIGGAAVGATLIGIGALAGQRVAIEHTVIVGRSVAGSTAT